MKELIWSKCRIMNRARGLFLFSLVLVVLCGCHRNTEEFTPKLHYAVQDFYLKQLPAPFPPLTISERSQEWGKEYTIGLGFAHQLDLYQAMTAFKRAEILTPKNEQERLLEMRYNIVLCYYLGHKWSEVTYAFEEGSLKTVTPAFPAYQDLTIILYDSYLKLNEPEKAKYILELIRQHDPGAADKLELSAAFSSADFPKLEHYAATPPTSTTVKPFLDHYNAEKKSSATARWLNAGIPGAGYLYLGQPQSALTAALLNGLFIAASYHFFHRNQIAAGSIFASFEAGWYFGGIVGAGLEAKYYNERLYERLATPLMHNKRLFPVLMLQYGF